MAGGTASPEILDIAPQDIIDNDQFNISRRNDKTPLKRSLEISGMLEMPHIVRDVDGFYPLTCHNRIKILKDISPVPIRCFIHGRPEEYVFINNAILKNYRGESGIIGRFKSALILKEYFSVPEERLYTIYKKVLNLPDEISGNLSYMKSVMSLPYATISYLDEKDAGFRTVKDIVNLPDEWHVFVDRCLQAVPFRLNLFRMLIDNLFDICRRGDAPPQIDFSSVTDDSDLGNRIFRIRYPEYSVRRRAVIDLVDSISDNGIHLDFPEYFEKPYVTIRIRAGKMDDMKKLKARISGIDEAKLKQLLQLL